MSDKLAVQNAMVTWACVFSVFVFQTLQMDITKLNITLLRIFRQGVAAALGLLPQQVHINRLIVRSKLSHFQYSNWLFIIKVAMTDESTMLPIFVDTVLFKHAMSTGSRGVCGCFHANSGGAKLLQQTGWPIKPKQLTVWPFTENSLPALSLFSSSSPDRCEERTRLLTPVTWYNSQNIAQENGTLWIGIPNGVY